MPNEITPQAAEAAVKRVWPDAVFRAVGKRGWHGVCSSQANQCFSVKKLYRRNEADAAWIDAASRLPEDARRESEPPELDAEDRELLEDGNGWHYPTLYEREKALADELANRLERLYTDAINHYTPYSYTLNHTRDLLNRYNAARKDAEITETQGGEPDYMHELRALRERDALRVANVALQRRVEELTRERDELQRRYEHCKLQAQCHAMEADTQTATVHECYAAVGVVGKGTWNASVPVAQAIQAERERAERAEAQLAAAREALQSIGATCHNAHTRAALASTAPGAEGAYES